MKKIIVILVTISILFLSCYSVMASELSHFDGGKIDIELSKYMKTYSLFISPYTQVKVNSNLVELKIPPVMIDNKMCIQLRDIAEALDAEINYDNATKTILVEKKINFKIGSKEVYSLNYLDNKVFDMGVPVFVVEGKAIVPIRNFCELLNAKITFDNSKNLVIIEK